MSEHLACENGIDEATRLLLSDAQTSGGLILAVAPAKIDTLLAELPGAVVIGEVAEREKGITIRVAP